jgi:DNA invertase Pin-like site-specific DNA recombinase
MIRVSTAGQADQSRAGIPAQREAIRKIAAAHDICIAPKHQFELTDLSGAHVLDSPEYQQFLRVVAQPDITAVVTKEFSRLMRPECFDDYVILQHFTNHGIRLYLPDAVLDFSNRQDRFMAGLKAAMAGMERDEIRQRMMDGKEAMRRQGRHPSAEHTLARGIGYNRQKGWYYEEGELEIVRTLFRLFIEGEHNYQRLASLTGIPRSSVRIVLTNPVYAGVMTYATRHDLRPAGMYPRKDNKRVYRRKIARPEDDVIRLQLPLEPIITIEQHQYIVDIVENMRLPRAQIRNAAIPRFTYRGYLRCGSCTNLVYSWVGGRLKNGEAKDFYYCKTRSPREREKHKVSGTSVVCENRYMSRAKLEAQIDSVLVNHLTEKQFIIRAIEAHLEKKRRTPGIDQAKIIETQLEKLAAKEKRIVEAFIDGNIDRFTKQLRLSEIADQVAELSRSLSALHPQTFEAKHIDDVVCVFREWPFLRINDKRRLMEQTLPEIYVDRYVVNGVTLRIGCNSDSHLRIDA